jgi:hypothetical protein
MKGYKTLCDRCGKESGYVPNAESETIGFRLLKIVPAFGDEGVIYDLCTHCVLYIKDQLHPINLPKS